jgi:hypothetical protein
VVAENVCALPKRNERCYELSGNDKKRRRNSKDKKRRTDEDAERKFKGSYFHPRAFEVCEPELLEHANHYDSDDDNNNSHEYDNDDLERYANDNYFSFSSSSSSSSSSSCHSSDSSDLGTDSDSDFSRACASIYASLTTISVSSPSSATKSSWIPRGSAVPRSSARDASSITYPQQDSPSFSDSGNDPSLYSTPYALEGKPKRTEGSGGKAKSVKTNKGGGSGGGGRLSPAARLAKLSGGFSDQASLLEGCLGGF